VSAGIKSQCGHALAGHRCIRDEGHDGEHALGIPNATPRPASSVSTASRVLSADEVAEVRWQVSHFTSKSGTPVGDYYDGIRSNILLALDTCESLRAELSRLSERNGELEKQFGRVQP
jgi:hypothetical protein